MKKVLVRDSYMALLKDYSKRTGVPVARCVSDALSDWLANVAPLTLGCAVLEPLRDPARKQNIIVMDRRGSDKKANAQDQVSSEGTLKKVEHPIPETDSRWLH